MPYHAVMSTEQVLIARVADRLWEARDYLIAGLVQMTLAEIGALDHDAASRSLLDASITENIVAAVHFLRQGIDAGHLKASTSALAYARMLAQRDVPLSALIRAYRIGHSQFLDVAFTDLDDLPVEDRAPLAVMLVAGLRSITRSARRLQGTVAEPNAGWPERCSSAVDQRAARRRPGRPGRRRAGAALSAGRRPCLLHSVAGRDTTPFDLVSAGRGSGPLRVLLLRARASLVVPTDERETRLRLALPAGAGDELETLTPPRGPSSTHPSDGRVPIWPASEPRRARPPRSRRSLLPGSADPGGRVPPPAIPCSLRSGCGTTTWHRERLDGRAAWTPSAGSRW